MNQVSAPLRHPRPATSHGWTTTEMPTAPRGYVKRIFCTGLLTSQAVANSQLPDHARSRSGSVSRPEYIFCTLPGQTGSTTSPGPTRDRPHSPIGPVASRPVNFMSRPPGPFQLQQLRRWARARLAPPTSAVANDMRAVSHDRQARHAQRTRQKKEKANSLDGQEILNMHPEHPAENPGRARLHMHHLGDGSELISLAHSAREELALTVSRPSEHYRDTRRACASSTE